MTETTPTRTPDADLVGRFKSLMGEVRETRSEANATAGEARELFKGLGFAPEAIAMFKKLSDMGQERGEAVFAELCQLLEADPDFAFGGQQPNMFAAAQVAETKGKRRRSRESVKLDVDPAEAFSTLN
jgi:hypothetical protein